MAIKKILGQVADNPVKYSSAPTRFASLHSFMQGAEIEEVNMQACPAPYEVPNNLWNMNIRSGVNQSDIPSKFGLIRRGADKIANKVFPVSYVNDWIRVRGEPVK